ncbi:MAG: LuxR C-terminal-related transcriptional regulator [Rikenellaceae bacterium]
MSRLSTKFCLALLFSLISNILFAEIGNILPMLEKAKKLHNSNPNLSLYYSNEGVKMIDELEENSSENIAKFADLKTKLLLQSAITSRFLGDFDLSISYLYDALGEVPNDNLTLKGEIEAEMSSVYCYLFDFNKAIELNDSATAIFKSLGDSIMLANCYNNRGIIECYIYEYDIAQQFFMKSLEINREHKLLKEVAANLNNMSLYRGDCDEKIDFLNEAIAINKNLDSNWSLAENYNNLGRQYYFAERYSESQAALNVAREYAEKVEAKALICDNNEYRADLYFEMGNYKEAYKSLHELYVLSSELSNSDKLRDVEQRIYRQNEMRQRQESMLQEIDHKQKLLRRNILLCIIIALSITMVSVLFYNWRRRKRDIELMKTKYDLAEATLELDALKIKQQDLELESVQIAYEASKKEAVSFAAFVQSRTELLNKIRTMIKQCEKMKSDEIIPHLKSANLFISQYLGADKGDSSLLMGVDAKNEEFLSKLSAKHTSLTSGEKKLASMLRINLSTKEIAILMGISPKTVNMNRYRLRKSLKLEADSDLVEYLKSI